MYVMGIGIEHVDLVSLYFDTFIKYVTNVIYGVKPGDCFHFITRIHSTCDLGLLHLNVC